jgi:hypothetical protein
MRPFYRYLQGSLVSRQRILFDSPKPGLKGWSALGPDELVELLDCLPSGNLSLLGVAQRPMNFEQIKVLTEDPP